MAVIVLHLIADKEFRGKRERRVLSSSFGRSINFGPTNSQFPFTLLPFVKSLGLETPYHRPRRRHHHHNSSHGELSCKRLVVIGLFRGVYWELYFYSTSSCPCSQITPRPTTEQFLQFWTSQKFLLVSILLTARAGERKKEGQIVDRRERLTKLYSGYVSVLLISFRRRMLRE